MQNIILSPSKIKELRDKYLRLREELRRHHEEESSTILMSFREAASNDADISAKESELRRLKSIIKTVKELPERVSSEKATLGSFVELKSADQRIKLRLVHPLEADPGNNLVSTKSPLGKLVNGRKTDDEFEFNSKKYTLINIS